MQTNDLITELDYLVSLGMLEHTREQHGYMASYGVHINVIGKRLNVVSTTTHMSCSCLISSIGDYAVRCSNVYLFDKSHNVIIGFVARGA